MLWPRLFLRAHPAAGAAFTIVDWRMVWHPKYLNNKFHRGSKVGPHGLSKGNVDGCLYGLARTHMWHYTVGGRKGLMSTTHSCLQL